MKKKLTITGIAIRMARDMKLHIPSPNGIFLEQECRRRLMWTVFVSDLLFHPVDGYIESDSLAELPLPCNIWSFTQGVPCRTLTMRQLQDQQYTVAAQQATNHCAFFITILCLRRKILTYALPTSNASTETNQDADIFKAWIATTLILGSPSRRTLPYAGSCRHGEAACQPTTPSTRDPCTCFASAATWTSSS